MKWVSVGVLGAAAAALWTGVVLAQSEAENRSPAPPQLRPPAQPAQQRPGMFAAGSAANAKRLTPEQRDEWRFLKEAAAASRFETEASKLALAKSKDPSVRSLATAMNEHHSSMYNTLDNMLRVRSMAAPMLANDQRKMLNRLSKMQGRKFDREYADVALRSEHENVTTYERAALVMHDPALKSWIEKTLPTMRNELVTAERRSLQGDGSPRSAKAGAATPGAATPGAKVTARNSP